MRFIAEKNIIVGLSGGIAAYRTLELIRLLKKEGAFVRPAPTAHALAFVTRLSLETLAQNACLDGSLPSENGRMHHIEEAYLADLIVIAPATCQLIAKIAHGFADDLLLQTILTYRGPLILAPAMETRMWEHPATQKNRALLLERDIQLVGPQSGPLASGRWGIGRMADPEPIFQACIAALAPKDFKNLQVLVTAGPTQEDMDPARYLSNRSSGKMGVALGKALAQRGAHVALVHGPLHIPLPSLENLKYYPVRTAQQMHAQCLLLAPQVQLGILCAAVTDFRPLHIQTKKIKAASHALELELIRNEDILKHLAHLSPKPFLVGFAAESEDLENLAIQKCQSKGADLICANNILEEGSGFESDTNHVLIVNAKGRLAEIPKAPKEHIAHHILDVIKEQATHLFK